MKLAGLALLVMALAGALVMWLWPEGLTAYKFGHIEARNFYFAQPNHLSLLTEPGDVLEIRPKRIAPSLLKRLEYRLGVRYNSSGDTHFTPYSTQLPRQAFAEGHHYLVLGVRDRVSGEEKSFYLRTTSTQPSRAITGLSPVEAVSQVFPSLVSVRARQVLAMGIYLLLGLGALIPWRERLPLAWTLLLSFPVGICLWCVMGISVLIVRLPYSPALMFSLVGAIVLAGGVTAFKRGNLGNGQTRGLGVFVIFFLLAGYAVAAADFTILLWDPWRYVIFGKHLAFYHSLLSGLDYARGYGIFLPLALSMGQFLGLDFLGGVQPLLYLNCLALLCFGLHSIMKAHGVAVSARLVLITAAVLLITCTSFFGGPGGMYWYTSNLWAGLLFFLAVVCLGLWKENPTPLNLSLVTLFGMGFGLSRIEGPVMALAVMLAVFAEKRPDRGDLARAYLPFVLLNVAWNLTIWFLPLSGLPDFLTTEHLLLAIGSNLLLAALMALAAYNDFTDTWLRRLVRWTPRLLLVLALGICAVKPERMANNIQSLVSNIFMEGAWGGLWFAVCLAALTLRWVPHFRNQSAYYLPTATIVLLSLDILIVRIQPLFFHVMDSGNRMPLFYFFPVVFYLAARFGCALGTAEVSTPSRQGWLNRLGLSRSQG